MLEQQDGLERIAKPNDQHSMLARIGSQHVGVSAYELMRSSLMPESIGRAFATLRLARDYNTYLEFANAHRLSAAHDLAALSQPSATQSLGEQLRRLSAGLAPYGNFNAGLSSAAMYVPTRSALSEIAARTADLALHAAGVLERNAIEGALERLRTPWAVPGLEELCAAGASNLITARSLAARADPFGEEVSKQVERLLGQPFDFDAGVRFPRRGRKRTSKYLEMGLDPTLLVPPPEVVGEIFSDSAFGKLAPLVDPDEPGLDLTANSKAHALVQHIENDLRLLLKIVLKRHYQDAWLENICLEMRKRWMAKRRRAVDRGRAETQLHWYAEFSDYRRIFESPELWPLFAPVFGNGLNLMGCLSRIEVVRIPAAHAGPITQADLIILHTEGARLINAIRTYITRSN